MSLSKRKLIQVFCLAAITVTALLASCSNKTSGREQIVMEYHFYSGSKEGIEGLHQLLQGAGYRMYEIRSYTGQATEEWEFTASKPLFVSEKTTEKDKIKKMSEKYHVNFNSEELPLEK